MSRHIPSLIHAVAFVWVIFPAMNSAAYDNDYTHRHINQLAAQNSGVLAKVMPRLFVEQGLDTRVYGKTVLDWLMDGGFIEDLPHCRTRHHFHDPLRGWGEAGFRNWFVGVGCGGQGESSLVWAQGGGSISETNGSSWQGARRSYFQSLTSTAQEARDLLLAETFLTLGQLMHLVADASVPAHVRNDSHIFPLIDKPRRNFESWTQHNLGKLNLSPHPVDSRLFQLAVANPLAPEPISALWDLEVYDGSNVEVTVGGPIGLAEYTNANFFSEDTVFKAYPHPSPEETDLGDIDWSCPQLVEAEDGKVDRRIYIRKLVGERLEPLLAIGYFYRDICNWGCVYYPHFDDVVFASYASRLVPRAVGYSRALLDYFFRGEIEISAPPSGVYGQSQGGEGGFGEVRLMARNLTPEESMGEGSLTLVVRYRVALEDPFRSGEVERSPEFSYIVAVFQDRVSLPTGGDPVELVFVLPRPIPLDATDVSLLLVFKGQLGREAEAVAIGFKDVSEPTPIDVFNNMDSICLGGRWYVAGSQEAIEAVDSDGNGRADPWEWDVYSHTLQSLYIRISPFGVAASPQEHNFVVQGLPPGRFIRVGYVIADHDYVVSVDGQGVGTTPQDFFIHPEHLWCGEDKHYSPCFAPGKGIRRQTEHHTDLKTCCEVLGIPFCGDSDQPGCCERLRIEGCSVENYPTFYPFRGVEMWTGTTVVNKNYPPEASCPWELLEPPP